MLKKLFLICLLLVIFSFDLFAQSGSFKARVVGIVDGDTVTVLNKENRQIMIRLAGVDAPEKRQDFGSAAKEFLAKLIFEKKVTVVAGKNDCEDFPIAVILLDGKNISLLMLEAGYAWYYIECGNEQATADRENYAIAEQTARKGKAGLWQQPNVVKPSEFRRAEKDSTAGVAAAPSASARPDRIIVPVPANAAGGNAPNNVFRDAPNVRSRSRSPEGEKTVQVKGYTRDDGTYVRPHTRSAPRRKN